jgi:hypothetical protein
MGAMLHLHNSFDAQCRYAAYAWQKSQNFHIFPSVRQIIVHLVKPPLPFVTKHTTFGARVYREQTDGGHTR